MNDVYHTNDLLDLGKPNFEMRPGYDGKNKQIRDFIWVPKDKTISKRLEIYIAHPDEGMIILDDSKISVYTSNLI